MRRFKQSASDMMNDTLNKQQKGETMKEMQPYHSLWRAVISEAIVDVKLGLKGGSFVAAYQQKLDYQHDSSLAWFLSASRDFSMVCHMAGLEPEAVRESVLNLVKATKKRMVNHGHV